MRDRKPTLVYEHPTNVLSQTMGIRVHVAGFNILHPIMHSLRSIPNDNNFKPISILLRLSSRMLALATIYYLS